MTSMIFFRLFPAWEGDGCMKDTDHPISHPRAHPGVGASVRGRRGCAWNESQIGLGMAPCWAGALAQIAQIGVHSARHTVDEGRCTAPDANLRGALQHRALAQRHRLCDAARYARRPASRNSCGTRSQARRSASSAAAPAGSKIAACRFFEHDYNDLAR